jgi:hypothetical protein
VARLNLTLDEDTFDRLARYARQQERAVAGVARDLVREALERHEASRRRRKLAEDYRAGRRDACAVLEDFEAAQLDVLDDDEA